MDDLGPLPNENALRLDPSAVIRLWPPEHWGMQHAEQEEPQCDPTLCPSVTPCCPAPSLAWAPSPLKPSVPEATSLDLYRVRREIQRFDGLETSPFNKFTVYVISMMCNTPQYHSYVLLQFEKFLICSVNEKKTKRQSCKAQSN